MGAYSQDPILSHLVGRYWYYHTGGGLQVSGHGTGGDGYQAGGGHGVHHQENGQHDHGTINDPQFIHFENSERNLESHEVLPASTYKLKKQEGTLQVDQA